MTERAYDKAATSRDVPDETAEAFWRRENLRFAAPHYRSVKAARIVARIARGRESSLLDVGCGPATFGRMLPANIDYYGIDIAIQDPALNLREADLRTMPISFGGKRFDIVLAQGFFEYVGDTQSQKFAEIAKILNDGGNFIVSYWNFGHRDPLIYHAFSNVQPVADFRRDLARHFKISRSFPAAHNWRHAGPNRRITRALNAPINFNIPFVSPALAVEYFFICSPR
jgi:SAM-dependent methyltransferase